MEISRIISHIFSIISTLLLVSSLFIMAVKYHDVDWERKVWIGSKILTLKNIMKLNNLNLYPIQSISLSGEIIEYKSNYATLLEYSGRACESNYKKCGILDSLGNIMCIPKDEQCQLMI